jgi:hypothetical protein
MSRERTLANYFGLPGTGKSAVLHGQVASQSKAVRFLTLDHEEGWGKDGYHWQGQVPRIVNVPSGQRAHPAFFEPPGVYRFPSNLWSAHQVGEIALALPFDVCMVDDEADKGGRRESFDVSSLRTILNEGRHIIGDDGSLHIVHGMFACRRPQKLHRDFDLAEETYLFRLKGGATKKRLLDDSLIDDLEEWEVLRRLPDFYFLHLPSGTWHAPKNGKDAAQGWVPVSREKIPLLGD